MATVPAPRRWPLPSRAAPRREQQPRPRPYASSREANRRPRARSWTVVALGAVSRCSSGSVVFHTVLLQNQRRLDQLDAQVRE